MWAALQQHASSSALTRTQTKSQIWTAGKTAGAREGGGHCVLSSDGCQWRVPLPNPSLPDRRSSSRDQSVMHRSGPGADPSGRSSPAHSCCSPGASFVAAILKWGASRGPQKGQGHRKRERGGCARAAWQRWKPGTPEISNREVKRNCLHGESTGGYGRLHVQPGTDAVDRL